MAGNREAEPSSRPNWPFDNEDSAELTFPEFVGTGSEILREGEAGADELARFALCGRLSTGDDWGDTQTVRVNCVASSPPISADDVYVTRDFDSLMGVSKGLDLNGIALGLFTVPKYTETLTKDIHCSFTFADPSPTVLNARGPAPLITVPVHRVPNFALGKLGPRGKVCVLLPALYNPQSKDRRIPSDIVEQWYNKVVRPTFIGLFPDKGATLDASYSNALTRLRNATTGALTFTTTDIAEEMVSSFARHLLENAIASNVPAFTNLHFYIEFRGEKNRTSHALGDADAAVDKLAVLTGHLGIRTRTSDPFWIDVAATVSPRDRSILMAKQSMHRNMLEYFFPEASLSQITRVLQSPNYHTDYFAQLYDIAGFRALPGSATQFNRAQWISVYSTAKNFHYSLARNIFSWRNGNDLHPTHPKGMSKWIQDIETICKALRDAAENPDTPLDSDETRMTGGVRMELRVRLKDALSTFAHLPHAVYSSWIVKLDAKMYW
jgi:hypothetical protein